MALAGGLLLAALLVAPILTAGPAFAQGDWFRPPADIGSNRGAPQQARPPQQYRQPAQRQQRPQRQAPPQAAAPQQRQQEWRPLFPLFDIFRGGDAPPRYVRPSSPGMYGSGNTPLDAPTERPRRVAPAEPAEPRGTVHASIDAARKAVSSQITDVVLVIGDEYAAPLAQGLADAFAADRAGAAVIAKGEGGSGLAADGSFDWLTAVQGGLAAEQEATAIVLFAGTNDLHPLTDAAGAKAELFDERWREIYGRRLDDLLMALKMHGRPVVVVGLPPVDDSRASDRNADLNAILKEHAERAGVIFVDVWDGFTDENGKFVMSGAAVDGARRRLRTADGAGFTRAGGRKLAFFVDRSLGKLLSGGDPAASAGMPQVPAGGGIPSIIQLTGPGAGGAARTLAGGGPRAGEPARPGGDDSAAARVLVSGEPLAPVSGRADDYTWNPSGKPPAAAAPAAAAPAPAAGGSPPDTEAGAAAPPPAPPTSTP